MMATGIPADMESPSTSTSWRSEDHQNNAAGLASRSTDETESDAGLGRLCDGGLPDNDVCNVLSSTPIDSAVLAEARARG